MLRFVAFFVFLLTVADAESSCESFVKYSKESAGGEGIVTIPTPKISNHEVKVKFTLDSRLRSVSYELRTQAWKFSRLFILTELRRRHRIN